MGKIEKEKGNKNSLEKLMVGGACEQKVLRRVWVIKPAVIATGRKVQANTVTVVAQWQGSRQHHDTIPVVAPPTTRDRQIA